MKMSMLIKCRILMQNLESKLFQIVNMISQQGPPPALALAAVPSSPEHTPPTSLRDSLLGDAFLWAVPKTRVSLEKRHKRKNGSSRIADWATPRKNLVSCLQCGSYHERHTICGTCYEKVKEEQKKMADAMPEHDRLYNYPRKEVAFVYQGENDTAEEDADRPKYKGKYIVELERPRPDWWPKHLLPKIHSGGGQ